MYSAAPCFKSYGVNFDFSSYSRQMMIQKVPQKHKDFLSELEWVVDLQVPFSPGRLVCVHAGLNIHRPAEQ